MNWVSYDKSKKGNIPDSPGQYLIATLLDDGDWCYSVCDFYLKGDHIILETPYDKMPDFIKNKGAEERLLWSILHDCFTCPEDGFYCSDNGDCWEVKKIDKWCKITPPARVINEGLCG